MLLSDVMEAIGSGFHYPSFCPVSHRVFYYDIYYAQEYHTGHIV